MGLSDFQERCSTLIKPWFLKEFGIALFDEMDVGPVWDKYRGRKGYGRRSIDLGTTDFKYGIEIKKSMADARTGYGLNQESFAYGYVLCPDRIVEPMIGHLYIGGYSCTGVITISDNDEFEIVKPARYNHNSCYTPKEYPHPLTQEFEEIGMWHAKNLYERQAN